jgi:hypothetical protein
VSASAFEHGLLTIFATRPRQQTPCREDGHR